MEVIGFIIFLLFIIFKSAERTREKQKKFRTVQRNDETNQLKQYTKVTDSEEKYKKHVKPLNYKKEFLANEEEIKPLPNTEIKKSLNSISFSEDDFVRGIILSEILQPPLAKRVKKI